MALGESITCTFVNSTGYPRPISATPTYLPLVLAFDSCTTPSRVHAPPLVPDSSCTPVQSSSWLTSGIPDAGAGVANSGGYVRLKAILGAAGPPDDSDMELSASVEDVRCKAGASPCGAVNNSGGPDYVGELQVQFDYRRTDREAGPVGGPYTEAGTLEDRSVSFCILVPAERRDDRRHLLRLGHPYGAARRGRSARCQTHDRRGAPGAGQRRRRRRPGGNDAQHGVRAAGGACAVTPHGTARYGA